MGMDVYGKKPTSERGKYFRNNIWWWRALWNYTCEVGKDVITTDVAKQGTVNSGAGLNAQKAKKLAKALRDAIETGHTQQWAQTYAEWQASLPREACNLCEATGIRKDDVGVQMGMPERELLPEVQILTGRTHGWCNACEGVGTTESWLAGYPFSMENVSEFADFLADSGGFEIW